MPRLAANLSLLFTERPFLDRFGAAAAAGFEAVECQFPYAAEAAAIRAQLDRHGLRMVMHNLPAGEWAAGDRGIACHPGRQAEFRDGVRRAIAYAAALGVDRLNCLAGVPPAGVTAAQARRTLVDNLRQAATALDAAGLLLMVEPINRFDVPGFLLNTSAEVLALLAEVGAANARLQFDLYHAHRMGEDALAVLRAELPRIGHLQIADHPGRHEPGTGVIDFAAAFASLDDIGYTGWVGCEYVPAAGTLAGLPWRDRFGVCR